MKMQQVRHILKEAGLTDGEIKVYLALLSLGSTTSGPIITQAKISRSKVYDILQKLLEKGLVSTHIHNNTKQFVAASPQRVSEYLKQKQSAIADLAKEFNTLIPQLQSRQKEGQDHSAVKIYVGFEGAKTFFTDMAHRDKMKADYYGFAFTDDALENKPLLRLFDNFLKDRAAAGSKSKILCNANARLNKKKMETSSKQYEFRETKIPFAPNIDVFDDIVAHTNWKNGGKIFVIEDKETANHYREYFLRLWKSAKK